MAGREYDKIYLEIEKAIRPEGGVFGRKWNKVRVKQIGFLLERPLMFKVLTEQYWGPALLNNLFTDEWWETEQEFRAGGKNKDEEIADMTILLLTLDSIKPELLLPSQKDLLRMELDDVVQDYCDRVELDMDLLMSKINRKIEINKIRNPTEVFRLVARENMRTSRDRMTQNWNMLKKHRDKISKWGVKKDWWKKYLSVDEEGWVKERS